jgi:hypothetical protein
MVQTWSQYSQYIFFKKLRKSAEYITPGGLKVLKVSKTVIKLLYQWLELVLVSLIAAATQ